ncbi:DUF1998 domain-containing protein [Bacillus salipaludis]|uniref:DUF1998 domain-containing protein n=1 Tax=Bacillus salipaludis TaxID=2547811 RepID=A0AA90QR39_9BACI|nr:DUF1998 domain-containing protein [Bacillus salipaludis]MDQ6598105.1 DUF1998 domain-containing protein [Bacillus salipaludis]
MGKKSPGGIRPSQLVTTFGPGSLVDFKDDSVMIMGLQDWKEQEGYYRRIYEPRLSARLDISYFLQPQSIKGRGGIPAISFPKYRVCSRCGSLRKDFRNDYRGFFCDCHPKTAPAYPARLIMACEKGHIDDFPWAEWCHKGHDKVCGSPDLYLKSQGRSSSLDDILILCKKCKASNTLAGALKKNSLKGIIGTCNGNSPWKREKSRGCTKVPRGLQRGASNVYFSSTVSALSIPPWTDDIQEIISNKWADIQDIIQNEGFEELKYALRYIFRGYDRKQLDDIWVAIKQRHELGEEQEDIRYEEWMAFQDKEKKTKHFHIEEEEVDPSISKYVSRVVLAHRLREIRVIRGFTRIDYPDPNDENEVSYSYLTSDRDIDWLPGVEILGEGIFIQLNEYQLQQWEETVQQKSRRYQQLLNRYQKWREEKGWKQDQRFSERFVLLHSLSHVLIRELSLSCGYSSNSIREKIYSGPNMCGILLYTGSPDSDGSLGGIIQQGRKDQFHKLLKQAIERAKICTSDPLCSESENVVENKLNLSACHACSLISETSCEWSNLLLDRLSLFQSNDNEYGFFEF